REHLEVVVDAAQLVRDLDQPELGEVPDVWRQLAGHAGAEIQPLDVLVEVLVDAVDEDRQRRLHAPEPRHEVPVGLGRASLKLARGEVEQPDEVVDDAVQALIGDQPREARADVETVHRADSLEGGGGDGREPELRPRERRRGEERERLPAEDLVTDRLVEEVAGGQALGPAVPLIEDPLGLEEQGLAESLWGNDDEIVVAVRGPEAVDLWSAMEEGLVEVLDHADVVGVNRPGSHGVPRPPGGSQG